MEQTVPKTGWNGKVVRTPSKRFRRKVTSDPAMSYNHLMDEQETKRLEERIQSLEKDLAELKFRGPNAQGQAPLKVRGQQTNGTALGLGILSAVAIIGGATLWFTRTEVKGSVSVSRSAGGALELKPELCRGGTAFIPQFFGVDVRFLNSPGFRIRLLGEPEKLTQILVWSSDKQNPFVLGKDNCKKLSGEIKPSGVRVNHVSALDGSAEFDCEIPSELRIAGKVQAETCH